MLRKEGRIGFIIIEGYVELEAYIKKSQERLVKAASNSYNKK